MAKFEYRIIKSSWGIAFDIYANVSKEDMLRLKETGENYILNINDKNLSSEQVKLINSAIESILKERKELNYTLTISIDKVEYNPNDYQLEGIYWAIREWLSNQLKLEIYQPIISFDKLANKYVYK